jgi:hypothetical protein
MSRIARERDWSSDESWKADGEFRQQAPVAECLEPQQE